MLRIACNLAICCLDFSKCGSTLIKPQFGSTALSHKTNHVVQLFPHLAKGFLRRTLLSHIPFWTRIAESDPNLTSSDTR